jgi:hypothetical protein
MSFTLIANNTEYFVTEHTAERMMMRNISEEMLIEVLEKGEMIDQPPNKIIFERDFFLEETFETIIVRAVVLEEENLILTVLIVGER